MLDVAEATWVRVASMMSGRRRSAVAVRQVTSTVCCWATRTFTSTATRAASTVDFLLTLRDYSVHYPTNNG